MPKFTVTCNIPTCFVATVVVEAASPEEAVALGKRTAIEAGDWELPSRKPEHEIDYAEVSDETGMFGWWDFNCGFVAWKS